VKVKSETWALIAPFATWMVLLFVLPSVPWAYAVRTLVTFAVLIFSAKRLLRTYSLFPIPYSLVWGVLAGLLVLVLWVAPEKLLGDVYRHWCVIGRTANASVDASGWGMRAIRLFGSAFVISVAEELFFRKWLMREAGFWWSVALFAAGHDRWLVAALTGVIYGRLALRRGVGSAIVAHIVTNLALGLYVLATGDWTFW